jgi:ATP-dependent Clp protease ATP-binding subunit ClpA
VPASELGNNYVGTEHALVGLIETESGLAGDIAARLGHHQVNTEHLLAAIVKVRDAYALCILDKLGVGGKDVRVALAARLSVDEELPVAQRRRRRRRLGRTAPERSAPSRTSDCRPTVSCSVRGLRVGQSR